MSPSTGLFITGATISLVSSRALIFKISASDILVEPSVFRVTILSI